MADPSSRAESKRDPSVLFQPPAIFGFRHQLPPSLPTFDPPAEVAEELRQRREQLRSVVARKQTVAAYTGRADSRQVSPNFAWGSVAAVVVSFLLIGAGGPVSGIASVVFLGAFGCVWYSWPYLTGKKRRRHLAQLEADHGATEGRIQQLEQWLAEQQGAHEANQQRVLAATPTWFGVPLPGGCERIEVFGGDKVGWEAMFTTMGASLLATGRRLVVLDFSERLVSTCLAHLASHTGRDVTQVFLPEQASGLDVFGGLDDASFIEVVVQAWQGGEVERTARVDMHRDRYVLDGIAACLDSPLTLSRLGAAVDFVLQQSAGAGRAVELTGREQALLLDSFGAAVRGGMQFTDRLMPLTAYIRSLGAMGTGQSHFQLADMAGNDLAVIALTRHGDLLDKAALMEIIVHAFQRHLVGPRPDRPQPSHLVVVGADLLGNAAIDRLHRFTEDAGIALVLFRARFDENTAKLAGAGNSTQLFMKLGNRGDAERAADHIGLRRYFVLSSASVNASETVTDTYGEAFTRSDGTSLGMMAVSLGQMPLLIPNLTRTSGHSDSTTWNKSTGKSTGAALTSSRVHERFVEPEVIQTLPPYVFLWKERGDLPLIPGDCDLELAYSSAAARELPK